MNMKKNLTRIALGFAFVALTAVIVTPIYVEYEHNRALERQAEWEKSAAEARRQPPSSGCSDGHHRVTDYSGPWPVSIPVWTDKGVLECDGGSYWINGKAVSSDEAQVFAMQALNEHRSSEEKRTRTPSAGPVIDYGYLAKLLADKTERVCKKIARLEDAGADISENLNEFKSENCSK